MDVKIKLLDEAAVIPTYAKPGDAGMDLTAVGGPDCDDGKTLIYSTGIALQIPVGYVGLIYPRSSIHKYPLALTNSVGVIDSGYRGEVTVAFRLTEPGMPLDKVYQPGDRIAQLVIVPYPTIKLKEVKRLTKTARGEGKYGSTGK